MKELICDQFQDSVNEVLIRHTSLLDIVTKLQEASAKVNRATIKTITACGCIKMEAHCEKIPENTPYEQLKNFGSTHISGHLCETCKEKLEEEMGNQFFYIAALCNHMDLDMFDILIKEYDKVKTLGKFGLY